MWDVAVRYVILIVRARVKLRCIVYRLLLIVVSLKLPHTIAHDQSVAHKRDFSNVRKFPFTIRLNN